MQDTNQEVELSTSKIGMVTALGAVIALAVGVYQAIHQQNVGAAGIAMVWALVFSMLTLMLCDFSWDDVAPNAIAGIVGTLAVVVLLGAFKQKSISDNDARFGRSFIILYTPVLQEHGVEVDLEKVRKSSQMLDNRVSIEQVLSTATGEDTTKTTNAQLE